MSCHAAGSRITKVSAASDPAVYTRKATLVEDRLFGSGDFDFPNKALGNGVKYELNVGCESCHGPGSKHWEAAGQGKAIVSPSLLTPEREAVICGQCHSRPEGFLGTASPIIADGLMMIAGTSRNDFLKFYATKQLDGAASDYFTDPDKPSKSHHQQYSDFIRSSMYKNGTELMTCSTCHNPHQRTAFTAADTHHPNQARVERRLVGAYLGDGTRNVLEAAKKAGVRHFIYQSAFGTRPNAKSQYSRTKWEAEELARASGLPFTILRPSLIYGPGDLFTIRLAETIRISPVLPVIGTGQSKVQPIFIDDVIKCILMISTSDSYLNEMYEIGGPEQLTYEEVTKAIAAALGIKRPTVHMPMFLMRTLAMVAETVLPKPPITTDNSSSCCRRTMSVGCGTSAAFSTPHKSPKRHHIYDVGTHSVEALRFCPSKDPIVRFATLLHDIGKQKTYAKTDEGVITFYNHKIEGTTMVKAIAERLRFSRRDTGRLIRLVRWHGFSVDERQTDKALRRFIRKTGQENLDDMLALRTGDRLGGGATETSWRLELYKKRLEEVQVIPFSITDMAVDGNDVMKELGIKPGPQVGKILEQLFEKVENKEVENDHDLLLKLITEFKT